jgi:hypothetical protein
MARFAAVERSTGAMVPFLIFAEVTAPAVICLVVILPAA